MQDLLEQQDPDEVKMDVASLIASDAVSLWRPSGVSAGQWDVDDDEAVAVDLLRASGNSAATTFAAAQAGRRIVGSRAARNKPRGGGRGGARSGGDSVDPGGDGDADRKARGGGMAAVAKLRRAGRSKRRGAGKRSRRNSAESKGGDDDDDGESSSTGEADVQDDGAVHIPGPEPYPGDESTFADPYGDDAGYSGSETDAGIGELGPGKRSRASSRALTHSRRSSGVHSERGGDNDGDGDGFGHGGLKVSVPLPFDDVFTGLYEEQEVWLDIETRHGYKLTVETKRVVVRLPKPLPSVFMVVEAAEPSVSAAGAVDTAPSVESDISASESVSTLRSPMHLLQLTEAAPQPTVKRRRKKKVQGQPSSPAHRSGRLSRPQSADEKRRGVPALVAVAKTVRTMTPQARSKRRAAQPPPALLTRAQWHEFVRQSRTVDTATHRAGRKRVDSEVLPTDDIFEVWSEDEDICDNHGHVVGHRAVLVRRKVPRSTGDGDAVPAASAAPTPSDEPFLVAAASNALNVSSPSRAVSASDLRVLMVDPSQRKEKPRQRLVRRQRPNATSAEDKYEWLPLTDEGTVVSYLYEDADTASGASCLALARSLCCNCASECCMSSSVAVGKALGDGDSSAASKEEPSENQGEATESGTAPASTDLISAVDDSCGDMQAVDGGAGDVGNDDKSDAAEESSDDDDDDSVLLEQILQLIMAQRAEEAQKLAEEQAQADEVKESFRKHYLTEPGVRIEYLQNLREFYGKVMLMRFAGKIMRVVRLLRHRIRLRTPLLPPWMEWYALSNRDRVIELVLASMCEDVRKLATDVSVHVVPWKGLVALLSLLLLGVVCPCCCLPC